MSLIERLAETIHRTREGRRHRAELRELVRQAVGDGVLTDAELEEIERRRAELGLTPEDLKELRVEAFSTALAAARRDERLSPEEESSLVKIATHFEVPETLVQRSREELARYRLLYEVEQGNLPETVAIGLVLRKGETVHWVEPGSILEERVLRRRYEGGSSGVSFRVMKGVTYQVGSSRGHITSETGIVPVSEGELILTSKRLIFRGNRKSVSSTWDKILDLDFYSDGLRVTQTSRSKPVIIKFAHEGNVDIVGALIARIVNDYGKV